MSNFNKCIEADCCLLKFGCCCLVCSCFSIVLLIFIAVSDMIMLVVGTLAYLHYSRYWMILDRPTTTVPVFFISIAVIRLSVSLCTKSVRKSVDSDVEKAEEAKEAGENVIVQETKPSKKNERTNWARFANAISWGLFISQLVGGIIALTNRHKINEITLTLENAFAVTRTDEEATNLIENLQRTEQCCGIAGLEDFTFHSNWPLSLRTNSCCEQPPCFSNEFPTGCAVVIDKQIYHFHTWLAVLGIGIPIIAFLLPLAMLIFALFGLGCTSSESWCAMYAKAVIPLLEQLFGVDLDCLQTKKQQTEKPVELLNTPAESKPVA